MQFNCPTWEVLGSGYIATDIVVSSILLISLLLIGLNQQHQYLSNDLYVFLCYSLGFGIRAPCVLVIIMTHELCNKH